MLAMVFGCHVLFGDQSRAQTVRPGNYADAGHTWAYAARTGASAAAKSASLALAAATLQDASTPSTSRPPCMMKTFSFTH